MRNKIGIIMLISALSLGLWLALEVEHGHRDGEQLKADHTLDSLRRVNRDHELHIMQLEEEVESLQDQLSDCTEDFQNCLAGRKIQIRTHKGMLTSNPVY